jgi:quercetin dioxygenase-like cupin family protein
MSAKLMKAWGEASPVEMVPGFFRRTLGQTGDVMLVEFRAEANVELPDHSHPHQQIGYLVSGKMEITIDGVAYQPAPGDCWSIPGGVPHQATFQAETVVIECFSPPREDYQD